MSRGKTIQAHRVRKNLTPNQAAFRAGIDRVFWVELETDGPYVPPAAVRVYIDRFTDGDVSIESWGETEGTVELSLDAAN